VADYDVIFGQRYDAGAILHEGVPPEAPFEAFATLSGQPGTRAPHHQIEHRGETLSLLDLFDRDFVLLSRDPAWQAAAEAIRAEYSLPLANWSPGAEDTLASYGIGSRGAVLVRPDGFVAWRTSDATDDRKATLLGVLDRIGLRAEAGGEV
jgi:putative polyketide hydroxylase